MKNKKKVITLITVLASTALVAGVTAGVVSFVGDEKSQMTFSDGSFSMTLGGTNGNVSVENLKTSNVVAKTAESNNVSFDYKNAQVVSNKVGKILAGGFYKNHDPI